MPGLTIFSKFCVLNSFLLMTKKITLVTKKSTYSLYFLINQYIQQQLRYLILQNVAIKVSLKIFWPKNLGVLVMMTPNQQLYYPLLTFGRQLRWSKMCGFSVVLLLLCITYQVLMYYTTRLCRLFNLPLIAVFSDKLSH